MGCCKCEQYKWPDPQEVVYTDEADGKGYCLFHAPVGKKGIDGKTFNQMVFRFIDALIANKEEKVICNLSGTVFPWSIDFSGYHTGNQLPAIVLDYAIFAQASCFAGVVFGGEASFIEAEFRGKARFGLAKFGGKADFLEAKFGEEASFYGAKFVEEARFSEAKFGEGGNFFEAEFGGEANFFEAEFSGEARFGAAKFGEGANFFEAEFVGEAHFSEAEFGLPVDFRYTSFEMVTHFHKVIFNSKADFTGIKAKACSLQLHALSSESLAEIDFSSLETEFFSFKGCAWPDKLYPETKRNPDYKACEELYRSLKQKSANEHDQPMVSKWHFREKEMALMQIKKDWPRAWPFTVTGLYKFSSGFGEKPVWAFWVLFGLVFFPFLAACMVELHGTRFAGLFDLMRTPGVLADMISTALFGHADWGKVNHVIVAWLRHLPLAKLPSEGSDIKGWQSLLMYISLLLITIQAALFAFALRNKFRR